jgi:hypothetical protein
LKKISKMSLYVLEGDFGDGKNQLLAELKRSLHYVNGQKIVVLEEPVQQCNNGQFEIYYKNPKKYALVLQLLVLTARYNLLRKTLQENPNAVIIMERSMLSDLNVFTKMHWDNGNISSDEHYAYMAVYNALNQFHIMGIFYLKVLDENYERPSPKYTELLYYDSFIRNTEVDVVVLDWQTLPTMVEIVRDTIAADFPNYFMVYVGLAVWFGILLFCVNLFSSEHYFSNLG